jgi:hypothetical protein
MTDCPGRDQLERLLAAPRGDGAGEELERHVETCSACQQAGALSWPSGRATSIVPISLTGDPRSG